MAPSFSQSSPADWLVDNTVERAYIFSCFFLIAVIIVQSLYNIKLINILTNG